MASPSDHAAASKSRYGAARYFVWGTRARKVSTVTTGAGAIAVVAAVLVLQVLVVRGIREALGRAGAAPRLPAVGSPILVTESALDDRRRAQLFQAIAYSQPSSEWPSARVSVGEPLSSLARRYYGIDIASERDTATMITRLIAEANGLTARGAATSTVLRVPPLPSRAVAADAATSTFDPVALEYELASGRRISIVDAERHLLPAPARAEREDGVVRVVLPQTMPPEATAAFERAAAPTVAAAPLRVEMLATPPAEGCAASAQFVTQSKYWTPARARVQAQIEALRRAAAETKLVIPDFGFSATDGHGAKVYSAAMFVLNALGIRNALERFVEPVELDPGATPLPNRPGVREVLNSYLDGYDQYATSNGLLSTDMGLAYRWVQRTTTPADRTTYSVDPVMMQALVHRHIGDNDWLNLSWRVRARHGIEPPLFDRMLATTRSFVVMAAGNDVGEVPRLPPQIWAALHHSFVNVTYGNPTGEIWGASGSVGGLVDVVAPGCGIGFDNLAVGDYGSSYASPIVATAAWLKHLLDRPTPAEMRHLIAHATETFPPGKNRSSVTSEGFFDIGRLLAGSPPHLLTSGGVVELRSAILSYEGENEAADPCTGRFRLGLRSRPTVRIIAGGSKVALRIRIATADPTRPVRVETCNVETVNFRATSAAGRTLAADTPAALAALGLEVSF